MSGYKGASRKMAHDKEPDPARLVAAEALLEVEEQDRFANLVLPKLLKAEQLSNPRFTAQDAAFTSELVYGTVRRRRTLDAVLAPLSKRPLDQLDPPVRVCLRLGAYQLLYMRVPDHAAVSETVSVARKLCGDGPSRTVNAVLRSLLREGSEDAIDRAVEREGGRSKLGVRHSHPDWMVDALRESLRLRGLEDQIQSALEANNHAAQVTLAARPSLVEAADLAHEAEDILGTAAHQGNLTESAVIIAGGDPGALPSIRSGHAGVQDEGSQLAAALLAAAPVQGSPDRNWLDLCAGPGGKAALLASIGSERGATVTANELIPHRARLLERSVRALPNVEVVVADGRALKSDHLFDRTLIDAPCLGLGSLRRRPESRWRHSRSDLDDLVPLQWELLTAGVKLTRPGGVVAWVTCSPHPDETVEQVAHALEALPLRLINAHKVAELVTPFDLAPPATEEPVVPAGYQEIIDETVQLWPHIHGTDAMFIALFSRTEDR